MKLYSIGLIVLIISLSGAAAVDSHWPSNQAEQDRTDRETLEQADRDVERLFEYPDTA